MKNVKSYIIEMINRIRVGLGRLELSGYDSIHPSLNHGQDSIKDGLAIASQDTNLDVF